MRKLRRDFPKLPPLAVRQVALPSKWHGTTYQGIGKYVIHLRKQDSEAMQVDTLLHEVAHAATWAAALDHDTAWAKQYAELVRWFQSEGEWQYDE